MVKKHRGTSRSAGTRAGPVPPAPTGATGPPPSLVVGLGASGGGLAPLQKLLAGVPAGRGLAMVVIHHPRTGPDALLISSLADQTPLRVVGAENEAPILANHVYVVPAGKSLSVAAGKLSVKAVSQCEGLRMPVDHFLCTLAADLGRRAVGIVLSGPGIDGTGGLAEIKALGGVTVVQDPATAECREMPQSAIDAGNADAVLSPEQMAAFLVKRADELAALTARQEEEAGLKAILSAVRNTTGHDFHCYKRGTLERRIRRRMGLRLAGSYDDYAKTLRTETGEAIALRQDLMIGVTEFFRQPEAWRVLEEKVIADLVAGAKPQSTLRVWVPACATGKEAYSLAILLAEAIERSGKKLSLQVFATDADASAVDVARAGQYAEDDLKGISAARRKRFFTRKAGRYEIVKELRELIVFAPQDLISDPPFSKLDLISCRNLLIYLGQSVQRKIIQLFHFALRESGCVFLGTAETATGQEDLFEPVSQKWRIYRKLGVATPARLELPLRPLSRHAVAIPAANQLPSRPTLPSIISQALAERFGPAAAVVDRKGTLLYTHGNVRDFLEVPLGEHTGLLADAAREGLRNRLTSTILQAASENKKIAVSARVKKDRKSVPVKVTVSPVRHPREAEGLLLVTFEEQKLPKAAQPAGEGEAAHSDVRQLEDELKITREELSSTIEQLEQSNEHLKASNEEVTSANEELQSTNEELGTSKEELQGLNEEVNAVNQRLQDKVVELEQAGNDMTNLLTSGDVTDLKQLADALRCGEQAVRQSESRYRELVQNANSAIIRWKRDGTVTFFNEYAESFFGYKAEEVIGKHVGFLVPQQGSAGGDLTTLVQDVAAHPEKYVNSVNENLCRDGRRVWMAWTNKPILDDGGQVAEILAVGIDLTERRGAEEALRQLNVNLEEQVVEQTQQIWKTHQAVQAERQRLYDVLETLLVYVVLLSPGYHVPFANRFFRERFGESNGRRCYEYLFHRTEPCEICDSYTVLKTGKPHRWYWTGPDGRDYDIYDFPFADSDGSPMILEMGIDTTEQKRAATALREAYETLEERVAERTAELARSNEELQQFAYVASHDLQEPLRMVSGFLKLLEDRYKPQLDDKAREYIHYSVEGATRMSQLIRDLLAYSRVEREGKRLQPTDAGQGLATALANLRGSIQEAGAAVTRDDLPTVQGDPSQLAQLFQNLVGNAVKFRSPDRPCQVHVGAEKKDDKWVFSVRDNGIGIDPGQRERVFVIFQRLHTREQYPGTGIGLAICRKVVERHGGRIWVESRPGEGSTFRFTLPAPAGALGEGA